MGGNVSSAATRGCRATHFFTAALSALVLALLFVATASAEPSAAPVVDHQTVREAGGVGLTAPAAVVETPDHAVWISDELYGVCRVTASGLVESDYCAPEPLEPPDGTIVIPLEDPLRPTVARQIAFDPATANFYVAEGSSGGSGVWRMHWDAATGAIDDARKIYDSTVEDDRVMALALTADGDVVIASKRSQDIRLLSHPATIDTPITAGFATTIGFSLNAEVTSLAVLGSTVYLADGGVLTRLDPATHGIAVLVDGQPASTTVSALAADEPNHRLYVGTSNANLVDAVLSYTTAQGFAAAPYTGGYTFVTGLGVGPYGALYIAQDPNAALTPSVESAGVADVFVKQYGAANLPVVRFTDRPQVVQNRGPWSFAFDAAANGIAGTTRFECRLDDDAPYDCSDAGLGAGSTTIDEVAEGVHSLKVRATNDPYPADGDPDTTEWGPTAEWVFALDTTRPVVTIDNAPEEATAVGGAFRLRFSADGSGPVTYTCDLDGQGAVPCSTGKRYTLALGEHVLTVVGTDAAGNASDPVTFVVTAVPAPPKPVTPPAKPKPAGPDAPGGAGSSTVAPAAGASVAVPATGRAPRLEIGVPCVEVSPSRAAARFRIDGRNALIRFRAPDEARYAKFTLRRAAGKRSGAKIVEALAYARVARAGATHTTRVALTRGQRRLVRSGRMRLAVAYGTCRTQVGRWEWIRTANATREGTR
jgi:hypothetical protein